MTEKIEIAKLATQLTISMLERKTGDINAVIHNARVAAADNKLPDTLLMFDYVFAHLQSTLKQ